MVYTQKIQNLIAAISINIGNEEICLIISYLFGGDSKDNKILIPTKLICTRASVATYV